MASDRIKAASFTHFGTRRQRARPVPSEVPEEKLSAASATAYFTLGETVVFDLQMTVLPVRAAT